MIYFIAFCALALAPTSNAVWKETAELNALQGNSLGMCPEGGKTEDLLIDGVNYTCATCWTDCRGCFSTGDYCGLPSEPLSNNRSGVICSNMPCPGSNMDGSDVNGQYKHVNNEDVNDCGAMCTGKGPNGTTDCFAACEDDCNKDDGACLACATNSGCMDCFACMEGRDDGDSYNTIGDSYNMKGDSKNMMGGDSEYMGGDSENMMGGDSEKMMGGDSQYKHIGNEDVKDCGAMCTGQGPDGTTDCFAACEDDCNKDDDGACRACATNSGCMDCFDCMEGRDDGGD